MYLNVCQVIFDCSQLQILRITNQKAKACAPAQNYLFLIFFNIRSLIIFA